ncbi:hypothetical protein TomTYG75_01370 [Sphingobium sp. TomTYG75]
MKKHLSTLDIPIKSAVIAWQPAFLRRNSGDAVGGEVAVFKFLDPGERSFAMTHGACWCDWAEQSVDELIDALNWLKRIMVREYGITTDRIEAAFACIPEYRRHQTDRGRRERRGEVAKRRCLVRTR